MNAVLTQVLITYNYIFAGIMLKTKQKQTRIESQMVLKLYPKQLKLAVFITIRLINELSFFLKCGLYSFVFTN